MSDPASTAFLTRLGITPREEEVLWAVVDRLRNREIADRLFISVRTVESHIASLLRKLDVADRGELIAKGGELRAVARGGIRLPTPFTSFVGREQESADLAQLLRENRLVTILGPPGIGKTRLAIHVCSRFDGVPSTMFADLTTASSVESVEELVGRALGVVGEPGGSLRETLAEAASDMHALVVVDNCEHVISGAAEVISTLLFASAGVKVLATSREALGLPGETTFVLQPMSLAEEGDSTRDDSEAVALFLERARSAVPSFTVTEDTAAAVGQICRRLDGLPLAIELVAPRLRAFSPQQIVELLGERFDVLETGNAAAIPRHRTLRAAIDWSYELLAAQERKLFDRLGIFPESFDLDAVLGVCSFGDLDVDEVARLFPLLLDKSLIVSTTAGSATRYRLLESLRLFAMTRLQRSGEFEAAAQGHTAYYARLAQEAAPHLRGSHQNHWLDRLEIESANLRTAIERAIASDDGATVARFITSLTPFWDHRGLRADAIGWLQWLTTAVVEPPDDTFIQGLSEAARVLESWDIKEASALAERALRLAEGGSKRARAFACQAAGYLAIHRDKDAADSLLRGSIDLFAELRDGWNEAVSTQLLSAAAADVEQALRYGQRAVQLFEEAGDAVSAANALYFCAVWAIEASVELDAAHEWLTRSLALSRQGRSPHGEAHALLFLARLASEKGDFDRATPMIDAALPVFRRLGDQRCVGRALFERARLAYVRDDVEAALSALGDCIRATERVGNHATATSALELCAMLLFDSGAIEEAATVLGSADAHRVRAGVQTVRNLPVSEDLRRLLEGGDGASLLDAYRQGGSTSAIEAWEGARVALHQASIVPPEV